MNNNIIVIKPKCNALIDQNRYIDGDPIGHICYNDAELIYKDTWFLCNDCLKELNKKSNRITLPCINTIILWEYAKEEVLRLLVMNRR